MKKLNEKEQAQVTGGYSSTMSREEIERHKGNPVDKYDGWEGNTYFFEYPGMNLIIGKLIKSYEDSETIYGTTIRHHDVLVIDTYIISGHGQEVGKIAQLNGDMYNMYEYID